ncbi:MAG: DNA polymerase III subunit beta [Francisellaceae bacterium]
MKCKVLRENLLKPLQTAVSIADKKHTMPILSTVLFVVENGKLALKASDLEAEVIAKVEIDRAFQPGKVTLAARKIMDIIRNLPEHTQIEITLEQDNRVKIQANRAKFMLSTLNADAFPIMDVNIDEARFKVPQLDFMAALKRVQFAMANNDVRYFLNGMLWEVNGDQFKTIATDGHRMAMSELNIENTYLDQIQLIVPRKTVMELQKIVSSTDNDLIEIIVGKNHFKVILKHYQFTSKLIDGRYPDYTLVIPKSNERVLIANRLELKAALVRTAILSNEKYRGVRLQISHNQMLMSANNPEHEEARDELEVQYHDDAMEIGFNVNYLLDVMNVLDAETIDWYLSDPSMSLLIRDETTRSSYVVGPIRL